MSKRKVDTRFFPCKWACGEKVWGAKRVVCGKCVAVVATIEEAKVKVPAQERVPAAVSRGQALGRNLAAGRRVA